ncbi:helix-turn-helix transcriptional regulator [Nocardioides sp.]|uniref:helix-turn-helix transcriptional regulator n=1 Tax=Nocardioides sp. TaxID=35761 RepID=UPI002ED459DF
MSARPLLILTAVVVTLGALLATVAVSSEGALWKLVLVAVALGLPGALAATVDSRNPVGWLLLAVGVVFAGMGLASQLVDQGGWASWVVDRAGAVVVPLMFLVLLLLPDGRLPSPRWRPVVATVVAAQVAVVAVWSLVHGVPSEPNPAGVLPASWAGAVDTVGDWVLQAPLLIAVLAVLVRLRRPEDRARLAGVLGGVAGFAVLAVAGHTLWPSAADAFDVLGALVLGAGLTATLISPPASTSEPTGPAGSAYDMADLSGLSRREREVLALVAEGLTNPQIAERLVISPVTARNHVSNILTKLGLENRTQAAAWLARGGHTPR